MTVVRGVGYPKWKGLTRRALIKVIPLQVGKGRDSIGSVSSDHYFLWMDNCREGIGTLLQIGKNQLNSV